MRPEHKTHKHATPASGLFNQTVQSKRRLYRALVSLHPLLFCLCRFSCGDPSKKTGETLKPLLLWGVQQVLY